MNPYLLSFLIFSFVANIVGGLIFFKGKKNHSAWLPFEYLIIYTPWLAFLLLAKVFFGGLETLWENPGLHAILILQSVAAGTFGGFILLPRMMIELETVRARLILTMGSAIGLTTLYSFMRIILLSVSVANQS